MKQSLHRVVASLHQSCGSTVQRFNDFAMRQVLILCALLLPGFARAQIAPDGINSTTSVSGQFVVIGARQMSPLASLPAVATNADFVRLEPALLAVSAERIKNDLWRELGVNGQWRGQIFLALHPARSLDENVTVASEKILGNWNCRVELPDVLSRTRLARALTGALLLEFADRGAGARPAEIPAWLNDGLALQLLAAGSLDPSEIILSEPHQIVNGLSLTRTDASEGVLDPLAGTRRVLGNHPALTFGQLSWPTGAQLAGADGGVYRTSAQLFVDRLLGLKDGPARLRAMLESLPRFYNWQTAFQTAFRKIFPRPLDVEKWWALQVVGFAAREPGLQWTPAVSRNKLDEILSVPVEMRPASNALPAHAEISFQAVIRNFDSARQAAILQIKLRDLELAQFHMASPLAVLTDSYRRAIAGYLGQGRNTAPVSRWIKHPPVSPPQKNADDTLKELDLLDVQRRTIEATIASDAFAPQSLNASAP
jgi:hypothetical protein